VDGVNGNDMVLLAGNSVPELAAKISDNLKIPLSKALVGRYADDEVRVQIGTEVPIRDKKVFIIQSTCSPAENWFELFLLADAARRAGAHDLVWVGPYLGYSRQDRKVDGHDPISAAVALNMAVTAGITQIISVDLHSGQLQGFVPIPFANLWGRKMVLRRILKFLGISLDDKEGLSQLAILAPDAGSYQVAHHYAEKFQCILLGAVKTRPRPNISELALVGGEKAKGRIVIILDEMMDTCGTMIHAADRLMEKEAKRVIAGASHALFSGNAVEEIEKSQIEKVVVTDTIPIKKRSPKIEVVSVASELAKAIQYAANKGIVSGLATQF